MFPSFNDAIYQLAALRVNGAIVGTKLFAAPNKYRALAKVRAMQQYGRRRSYIISILVQFIGVRISYFFIPSLCFPFFLGIWIFID